MKKLTIIPAVALALTAVSTTACATGYAYGQGPYRDRGGYNDGRYARELERRAYDEGFRQGIEDGRSDARKNRRYEPARHGEWRDADRGYHREYGEREFYRRSFRNGYEAGYAQAYRANDRGYRRW